MRLWTSRTDPSKHRPHRRRESGWSRPHLTSYSRSWPMTRCPREAGWSSSSRGSTRSRGKPSSQMPRSLHDTNYTSLFESRRQNGVDPQGQTYPKKVSFLKGVARSPEFIPVKVLRILLLTVSIGYRWSESGYSPTRKEQAFHLPVLKERTGRPRRSTVPSLV